MVEQFDVTREQIIAVLDFVVQSLTPSRPEQPPEHVRPNASMEHVKPNYADDRLMRLEQTGQVRRGNGESTVPPALTSIAESSVVEALIAERREGL